MADIFSWDAVFTELIHQRTREDVVEEKIHVFHDHALRRLIPFGAPKNRKNLNGSEQRSAAVAKPGGDCRGNAFGLRAMEWHDPDGVLQRGRGFLATRLAGHGALLARADGFVWRGLGYKQAGVHTVPNGANNVNGTSHKRPTLKAGIFGERMWYCADKHARRLDERAGESAD